MKKLLLILLTVTYLNAWGKTGHRVVGEIASYHLTPEASQMVDYLLDGESLAMVSTYPDKIKADKKFRYLNPYHYVNMPLDKEYWEIEKKEKDIVKGISKSVEILSGDYSKEEKAFWLKMLVHLVGDVHQPMHTGRYEDRGGNDLETKWYGSQHTKKTNLHLVWDLNMIDHYKVSYSEFAKELNNSYKYYDLTPKLDREKWVHEPHLEWVWESHQEAKVIYKRWASHDLSDFYGVEDYMYENFDLVKVKLYKAGRRLAMLLNEIYYDRSY